MIGEIVRRTMIGIAYGGLATFIALTILLIQDITPPIQMIWSSMFGSFLLGIYFGVSSLIFELEKWSPLKMTLVHFTASVSLYYLLALPIGWVPVEFVAIAVSFVIFVFIYAVFWYGFWSYHKRMAWKMNEQLHRK